MTTFQDYKRHAIADAIANGRPVPDLVTIVCQWMEWKKIQK